MRLSKYFLPILKENPTEAKIVSHRLMLRAGMIRQVGSGIYNWLPLGLRVLNKISQIIRKNLDEVGCQELLMPAIQSAELWQESGRYDDYGKEMLRFKDRHEKDLLYGPTHEEVITDLFRKNIHTYKELPKNLYQIQWKFRDEIRPRFGVMRGREFLMKDAYSFDLDYAGAKESYDLMFRTYIKIFKDLGLDAIPVKADSGAIGGDLSHEFHVVAETGESLIFYDSKFDELAELKEININTMKELYAVAEEKHNPKNCPVEDKNLRSKRGIEVGHIFYFGTKYSQAMNATVTSSEGKEIFLEMGSYGIGVSRLIGAIIEAKHDERGICWPKEVAPFDVVIINLKVGDSNCDKVAEDLYLKLNKKFEVLYDDKTDSIGAKFATHDLIGIPKQIIIGPKNALANRVELKCRYTDKREELSIEELLNQLMVD
jgi:prolyl-tRNA synthetase